MKVDGRCHCGDIAYEADADPDEVVICNCSDCQILSGSAFRVVVPFRQGTFRLMSGVPRLYEKTADSGRKRLQAFCPRCGTPLYSEAVSNGPGYLRVGGLRQRAELVPRRQIWHRSYYPWIDRISELPAVDTQ